MATNIANQEHIAVFEQELASQSYQDAIVHWMPGEIISVTPYLPGRAFVLNLYLDKQEDRDFYGHSARLNFFSHDYKGEYFDSLNLQKGERVQAGMNPAHILMNVERL